MARCCCCYKQVAYLEDESHTKTVFLPLQDPHHEDSCPSSLMEYLCIVKMIFRPLIPKRRRIQLHYKKSDLSLPVNTRTRLIFGLPPQFSPLAVPHLPLKLGSQSITDNLPLTPILIVFQSRPSDVLYLLQSYAHTVTGNQKDDEC